MFGKTAIEELLDLYSLEDLFEVLEIEPALVLEILLEGGHISLDNVPFLEEDHDEFGRTREEA